MINESVSNKIISINPPFGFFPKKDVPDVGELMAASFPLDTNFMKNFAPKSWWMGEKYDGIRCCWNPIQQKLYSRTGNNLLIWPTVINHLPSTFLDSELWFGRGQFSSSYAIVSGTLQASDWNTLRLVSFDIPPIGVQNEPFELRYTSLLNVASKINPFVIVAPRVLVKDNKHLNKNVTQIIEQEGEGAVLRLVASLYVPGRSSSLFKLKSAQADQDAIIEKIFPDKSVQLKLPNGTTFIVPSVQVQVPVVKVGEIITFTYETTSRRSVPSNPSIIRIRSDISWDDVVYNAAKEQKFIKENLTTAFKSLAQGYWTMKNMRLHMESLAKKLGHDPLISSTWYTITERDVRQDKGGRVVLLKLNGYVRAITRLFPELRLEKSAFPYPLSWWRSVVNRRKFFEGYALTHGFDPLDANQWYIQPREKIISTKGAYRVLFYHESNITKALLDLFPEIQWDNKQLAYRNYRLADSRRAVFENYATDNSFEPLIPGNWYSQPIEKILATPGARRSILHHNSSVSQALIELFPEVHFEEDKLPSDTSNWSSIEQRRSFFENYARVNGFDPLNSTNWYKHKEKFLLEKHALDVMFYHNNRIYVALADLFPESKILKHKFKTPRLLLRTREQRREVMERVATHMGFDPLVASNWYSLDISSLRTMEGVMGVIVYHRRSIRQALLDLFPEIGLDITKFSESTWKDISTRRNFFDLYAKQKGFDPKIPENWYKQPIDEILALPDAKNVLVHHNKSIPKALTDLYREIDIDPSKFSSTSKWSKREYRQQFFIMFAKENGFDPLIAENWYSVSATKLRATIGARKVLLYHKSNISKALLELFPSIGLRDRKLKLK